MHYTNATALIAAYDIVSAHSDDSALIAKVRAIAENTCENYGGVGIEGYRVVMAERKAMRADLLSAMLTLGEGAKNDTIAVKAGFKRSLQEVKNELARMRDDDLVKSYVLTGETRLTYELTRAGRVAAEALSND